MSICCSPEPIRCLPPTPTLLLFKGTQGEQGLQGNVGPTGAAGPPAQYAKNVAVLKALDVTVLADGQPIFLGGYFTDGDGGAGIVIYDAGSVLAGNDGTVFLPAVGAGAYLRPYTTTMNVRQFGALGDGVTDDLDPIQRAVTAVRDAGIGAVYFPAGTYLISAQVVLANTPPCNISLLGDGPNVSVIQQTTAGANGFNFLFDNDGAQQPYRVTIENIGMTCSANAGTAIIVSYGNPAVTSNHLNQSVLINNISIRSDNLAGNWTNGIDITSAWNTQISNVFISGDSHGAIYTNLAGDGIRMRRYCTNTHITNCQVAWFLNAFHWTAEGVGVNDGNTEGLHFANCNFTGCRRGVQIEGNPNATTPRVSGVTWTGGLMDLRACVSAFEFYHVEDFLITNTFLVQANASGVNYGCYLSDCGQGSISNVDFFAMTTGVFTTGICFAIVIHGCVFRSTPTQVNFTLGTTDCTSFGHVLSLCTAAELTASPLNRIYALAANSTMVHKTADQLIPEGAETPLTWAAAYFDDLTLFNIGTPTLIAVPANAKRVRVTANINFAADATGYRKVRIKSSNAAGVYPLNATWARLEHVPGAAAISSGDISMITPVIDVQNITAFLVTVQLATTAAVGLNVLGSGNFVPGTSFCLEVIR